MTLSELLTTLNGSGVRLGPGTNLGTLQIDAPAGVLTSAIRGELASHKSELLALLQPDWSPSTDGPFPGTSLLDHEHQGHGRVTPMPGKQTPDLSVAFGSKQLPFAVWDGQQLPGMIIGIDTETHPIVEPDVPTLVLASVSDGEHHFVLGRDRLPEFLELHNGHHFVAHHMPFDFWVIANWLGSTADAWWSIADRGRLHCTNILEQLNLLGKTDQYPRGWSLDSLTQKHLNVELFGKDDPRRQGFDLIDGQPLQTVDPWYLQYAVQDAIAVARVYSEQQKTAKRIQLRADNLLPDAVTKYGLLSETLQVRGAVVLAQITQHGMHLDTERVQPAKQELRQQLFEIADELDRAAPPDLPLVRRYKQERFVTSDNGGYRLTDSGYPQTIQDHVRQVFARIAHDNDLKPPKSDSGKLSLTRDFWADHRELSPVVDLYLELQSQGKTLGFFRQLHGGHIHPKYTPMVRSGRVSCQNPNVQQMPRDGNVREMFVPSPGHVLLAIDFAALELRTLAAVCLQKYGTSQLAEIINSGQDPHAYSYCQIHGMTMEEFADWKAREPGAAKAARDKIKGLTFGIPGSMQAAGLVRYVKKSYGQVITEQEAKEYRNKLIEVVYPEWERYLNQTGTTVHTLTGRVRGCIQRSGQLFNTQFQGLASDGAKLCLWKLMRAGYRIVGFVHDEFLIELPIADDYGQAAADIDRICCETMAEFTPGVPIACEYTVATVWSKKAEAVWEDGKLRAWTPEVVNTPARPPAPGIKLEKDCEEQADCQPGEAAPLSTNDSNLEVIATHMEVRGTDVDISDFASESTAFRLADPDTRVIIDDCRSILPTIKAGTVDCVFADQPFNIGVDYKDWNDNLPEQEFWDFTYEWVDLCVEVLAPTGSLFAWLPPTIANRVAVHLEDRGMFLINDIVVVQRFGQCRTTNFITGHVRLLYFAKERQRRTWNADDILVPSLRATKYKDKRTMNTKTPGKRVPFDVWGVDEQYFGRVSGAHSNKERRPQHPNQVPEVVVKRALLATTNPGDLVLDPFAGSGTTGAVARALGRRSIGIEISPEYAKSAFERIKEGAVRV